MHAGAWPWGAVMLHGRLAGIGAIGQEILGDISAIAVCQEFSGFVAVIAGHAISMGLTMYCK